MLPDELKNPNLDYLSLADQESAVIKALPKDEDAQGMVSPTRRYDSQTLTILH